MKRILPYLFIFVLAIIASARFSYAQGIQTGDSGANVTVETSIKGNGNVKTHIETSANEEKKVLDATGQGTYKVEVRSGGNNNSKIQTPTASVSPSQASSSAPEIISKESNRHSEPAVLNFINSFKKSVEDFFKRIFNSLKLDKSF